MSAPRTHALCGDVSWAWARYAGCTVEGMNHRLVLSMSLLLGALVACGGQGKSGATGDDGGGASGGDASGEGGGKGSDAGGVGDSSASSPESGAPTDAGTTDSKAPPSDGGLPPAGWLYTVAGKNHVYVSNGSSGTVWMGRGVNMDDVFLCGYNEGFWMANPNGEQALAGMLSDLMTSWKPTFVRVSLAMDSYPPYGISWSADTSQYATTMTSFIEAIGAHPNTYVLVTLRSEASMVNAQNAQCAHGGDDAVCIPTSGTDATYKALVDTFKDKPYVLFGISNEPGGNDATQAQITSAMSHAVGTIRAEEDAQGVPHHLVSVQGLGYTSNIAFYDTAPLPYDNVVYEFHSYPPQASAYTQSNIPVIIGEYGPSGTDTSFTTALYADLESKQIPNLAWDLDTYNNCSPDLANVTTTTAITPSAWGLVVKAYLSSH